MGRKKAIGARATRRPRRNSSSAKAGGSLRLAAEHEAANVPIVGIGASAGGIDALGRFFEAMPTDCGLAYVVILHLDPTHESQMAQVLGSRTSMPVAEIVDGMRLEPDRVYVIVPDSAVSVSRDQLVLTKPTEARGHRYPVDVLFSSLAAERQERAIAIVLSGTGSNGTHGLQDVRANGGLILVQEPETARFDGMPRSAIAAGLADHILPAEEMANAIRQYVDHGYMAMPGRIGTAPEQPAPLESVLTFLRVHAGQDFRGYRQPTLERRIHRRMSLTNAESAAEYIELMRSTPDEVEQLARDLMISVTGFFRDPEAWQSIEEKVIAPLVADREANAQIRFWVPACATGEEAYSLAMLAIECAEQAGKPFDFKIFATDSQEQNLRVAREGVYPHAAAMTLAPDRLQRFFERLDSSYRVTKDLRDMVVFAQQNLLHDPPFSRMDLVSCRNLLIYLEPDAQWRVLAVLHFALRRGGHLILGNAETVGRYQDLFERISKRWRLYRRLGPTRHDVLEIPLLSTTRSSHKTAEQTDREAEPIAQAIDMARRHLLERYVPASVLVDRKGRILYFHGLTGDYLEPPAGEPTRDLLAMARNGLRLRLRKSVRQAADNHEVVTFCARVRRGGADHPVSVTVAPLATAAGFRDLLLVSFQPTPASASAPPPSVPTGNDEAFAASADSSLEDELRSARAEVQNTLEQMESANEELKAANEEVTSMNEELQSTNEELEASKEELQAFNEELHTINSQLQHKVQELEDLSNDQNNLLAGTEIATIFLDSDLCIKWFSPVSVALLDLVPSDIGRPLGHFARKFTDDDLLRDAKAVLKEMIRCEAEIRSDAGRWYLRRLLPYRTQDNRITGVVLTFMDITERKHRTDAVNEERLYAQAIVETIRQPLLVLDTDLRVQSANRRFYELFGLTAEKTEGVPVFSLGNGQWDIPALRTLLEHLIPGKEVIDDFVVECEFETLGRRVILVNARRFSRGDERAELILLAIEDITARSQAEAHRDLLLGELTHRIKNVLATVQAIASQTLRRSPSMEAFGTAFGGRLLALASIQDLLVGEGRADGSIRQLVRRTLEPYGVDADGQIILHGPETNLPGRAGGAIVMILHELATNAAKYGALSTPAGSLEVTWQLEGAASGESRPQVRLRWSESGGPKVEPSTHRGFGTEMIELSVAHELNGKAVMDFRQDGLLCELVFPVPALQMAEEITVSSAGGGAYQERETRPAEPS